MPCAGKHGWDGGKYGAKTHLLSYFIGKTQISLDISVQVLENPASDLISVVSHRAVVGECL